MLDKDNKLLSEAVASAERHWEKLHDMPELALKEYRTTEYIGRVVSDYPVSMIDIGMPTGLIAYLDAGADETVALRADIDAVPTEHGARHLCGHDAHTATLLGAMHYLCGSKPAHNILFIFQPGEEGTHGAREMLGHGLLDKVPERPSMIFGIHNRPELLCGDVAVHRGPLMSEKSIFEITYTGKPGHGSLPHKCVDPIVAACSFVCGMQTIVSRNTDPFHPVICTVNSMKAGDPGLSAPETAVMTGYIRSFNHETHLRMTERIQKLAASIAEGYECKSDINITHMVPAVDNSEKMYEIAYRAAAAAVGEEHIVDTPPSLASEDFAVFGTEIPSFFYWVGSGTAGRDNAPWHDPGFAMDPGYMKTAVPVMCSAALAK